MNKGFLIVAMLLSLGLMASVSTVIYAQDESPTRLQMFQRIAQRFSLDPKDVKKVFEEGRVERFSERISRMDEHLKSLVSSGKITESQKSILIAKHKEMHEKRLSFSSLSESDRRQKNKELREEYHKWLSDNNINIKGVKHLNRGRGF